MGKMKLKIYVFLLSAFCGISSIAWSQGRNNIWCFGDSSGIDFSNITNPVTFTSSMDGRGSCVSIADQNGNLQFYSYTSGNGFGPTGFIYNLLHQIMQDGDSIMGQAWYQEMVIVPDPSDTNIFYLFCVSVTTGSGNPLGLFYSKIDLSQNGGLGQVIQKNVQLQSFKCTDGLIAIKHGNGRDWWIIFRNWNSVNNVYYKYLITPSGISNLYTQSIGAFTDNGFTKMRFNSSGNKMVSTSYNGLLEVYDFDRCSGLLSNPITIHPEPTSAPYGYFCSCDFSPNGRFLYVASYTDSSQLFQYDLLSPSPASTRIILDTFHNWQIGQGMVRRAPDGKIYMTQAWECTAFPYCFPYPDSVYNTINMNLSVINYPDSLGTACGYAPYSFYLGGTRTYYGLPNNPDYELGPLIGSGCDTLTSLPPTASGLPLATVHATWSPNWQKAFINATNIKGHQWRLEVFDLFGNIIYSDQGRLSPPYFSRGIELPGIASGMYIVRLLTEKEQLTGKFLVN
jgi:hypothetical protein